MLYSVCILYSVSMMNFEQYHLLVTLANDDLHLEELLDAADAHEEQVARDAYMQDDALVAELEAQMRDCDAYWEEHARARDEYLAAEYEALEHAADFSRDETDFPA